jgi:hypothetical protein
LVEAPELESTHRTKRDQRILCFSKRVNGPVAFERHTRDRHQESTTALVIIRVYDPDTP